MNNNSNEMATGSSSSKYYFLVWLALGAASIFYVTVASLAPDALRSAGASGIDATNTQVAALSTSVSEIKAQLTATDGKLQTFAGNFDGLRNDVIAFRSRLEDFGRSVEKRFAVLEGAQSPGAKASAGPANTTATTQAIATPAPAAAPRVEGVVLPDDIAAPPDPTDATAAKPAKPLKVASVATDTKPAAAPKPYAIDLAMSTSTDALRQIWQLFKDQHADLLAGLTPRSVTAGANVRLLAGPFPSQAAAAAQCARMRKDGVACTPTPLAGTPL